MLLNEVEDPLGTSKKFGSLTSLQCWSHTDISLQHGLWLSSFQTSPGSHIFQHLTVCPLHRVLPFCNCPTPSTFSFMAGDKSTNSLGHPLGFIPPKDAGTSMWEDSLPPCLVSVVFLVASGVLSSVVLNRPDFLSVWKSMDHDFISLRGQIAQALFFSYFSLRQLISFLFRSVDMENAVTVMSKHRLSSWGGGGRFSNRFHTRQGRW